MVNAKHARRILDVGLAVGLVSALIVIAVAEPRSPGNAVVPPPVEVASAEPPPASTKPSVPVQPPQPPAPAKQDIGERGFRAGLSLPLLMI